MIHDNIIIYVLSHGLFSCCEDVVALFPVSVQ